MPEIRGSGAYNRMPGQDIYSESSTKQYRLGTRLQLGDRVFYYAQASEALTAGKLATVQTDTDAEDTVTVAHAADTKAVTITAASAITANQYADGYLVVDEGTGAGDTYRIRSHPAITNATTGVITLFDGLVTAWATADTDVTLYQSIFRVQESNVDQIEAPIGVPLIDVTDEYYFWLQTWGPCAVLFDEILGNALGQRLLTIGSSTAGSVEAQDAIAEAVVGQALTDAADYEDAKYQLVLLQVMP